MSYRAALATIAALTLLVAHAWAGTNLSLTAATADPVIRVGLVRSFRAAKQVTVLASSDYCITRTGSNDKLASPTNLEPITIEAGAKEISLKLLNGTEVSAGQSVTVTPASQSMISVDSPGRTGKQYRGTLEVSLKGGCLQLVNAVNIEDYLPGVLTGEMPSSYPLEAQKAQAVAARNYTLCSRGRHSSSGYDVCDEAHCQCYDGAMREKPGAVMAVIATKGQVLTYDGRLASIMYCADCGGVTESYAEAHNKAIPYLVSVPEPTEISHCSWIASYTLSELSAKLTAAGVKEADGLQKVAVTKTSASGRALEVEVTGPKGSSKLAGLKFRSMLGRDVRSTLFTIETTKDGVSFKGKGWGHGIGLCQVGAGALACPPLNYTYQQILAHYYPGTLLSNLPGLPAKPIETRQPKVEQRRPAKLETPPRTIALETKDKPKPAAPKPAPAPGIITVRVKAPSL